MWDFLHWAFLGLPHLHPAGSLTGLVDIKILEQFPTQSPDVFMSKSLVVERTNIHILWFSTR